MGLRLENRALHLCVYRGTAGVLAPGALMNFASPSGWERFIWGPCTLTLAELCLLFARGAGKSLEQRATTSSS